jgi:uncharacterized protein (DUF302 family)
MIDTKSKYGVHETGDRLEKILTTKGMKIFNRISHSENAAKASMELRPTELFIFGDPKVGTLLMQCSQSVAIDLPLKMLVWEDEKGSVWLSYNDPNFLKERHNIQGCDDAIARISAMLEGIAKEAASP